MNTRFETLAVCLLVLSPFSATGQKALSLDDCIGIAHEKRIDIRRQHNAIEMQRLQLETAKGSYIPTVEANITPVYSTGMNMDVFFKGNFLYLPASIEAHMPLLDLGIRNGRQAKDYGLKAAEARYRQSQRDVAIAVTSYYLQAQYAKNALSLAMDMVKLDQENLDYVSSCVSDGAIAESEKIRAELALSADEKNVIAAQGMVRQALLELQHFINSEEPVDVPMASDSFNVPGTISVEKPSAETDVQVVASQYELLGSQSDLKAAKTGFYPTVSLGASAGGFTYDVYTNADDMSFDRNFWDNRNAAVWVNVNIPILDYSGTRSDVRSQRIHVLDRQMALDQARQDYLQKIELLENSIETGRKADEKMIDVIASAQSNYTFQQDRYEGGYCSWTELQDAKRQLFEARASQLDNWTQYTMDLMVLDIYLKR